MDDDADERGTGSSGRSAVGRRAFLGASAAATASVSGCLGLFGGNETPAGPLSLADFRGSGPMVESRPELNATSMDEMDDLSGELTVYRGGAEAGLYDTLLELLTRKYDDFEPNVRSASSASHANTIISEMEGAGSPADVFWSIDAGALARVAKAGYTRTLPTEVVSSVPSNFRPKRRWVGTAGRARSVPYNSDVLSASEVPGQVRSFPDAGVLSDATGWAPSYGAFQSFVTAMRVLRGRAKTKAWLQGMLDHGVSEYPDEFLVANAVADGEVAAGFTNHYYALRVKRARPEAPLELAFTSGGAGALVNTAGAAVIEGTDHASTAELFVRHLLSAEAQEFFATRTFAYPMVPGVPPVGGLPTIDDLEPPDLSLGKLSNVEPTIELLKEVGAL